ncbi:ATP-binding protein [Streptomyces sp. NBC_01481]|uniref:ATP-binding protein n=1 Tax=Streptomyces sp. NBC_01481 TaxID=2975869 RepID=UPI00224EEC17|nr:ATP-binding protein [Streptomyces sp. NBC_01481]MCX4588065.1 ATP-binding protein [Streptomyces sp. NBC_01481]
MIDADATAVETAVMYEWSMGYTMVRGSVALARAHTRRRLSEWDWRGDADDAVLIVSELVTNAIAHGRRARHELRLKLAMLKSGQLVVEVSDPVAELPSLDRTDGPGDDEEHGRGLLVVRQLAGEIHWFAREHVGKTVRVVLTVESPSK